MKPILALTRIESKLFVREFFGFFFTFIFPVLMLLLFGALYGNAPMTELNGLGMMDVSVPAYSAMIVGVTGLMAFPLTLYNYKDKKVYKRYDATPVGKGMVICVQTFVNFVMTVLGFLLLFLVGTLVFHIQVSGSPLFIVLMLLLSIAAIFSIGFLFTAIAPNLQINNVLCYVAYFGMIFLSGSTLPQQMFPEGLRKFSEVLPLTHVVHVLQGSFGGIPFSQYRASVFVLLGVLVVCAAVGGLLYKRKSWA